MGFRDQGFAFTGFGGQGLGFRAWGFGRAVGCWRRLR